MKIVVDTNIVISAIINNKGKIGEILLNRPETIEFVSPSFLLQELENHKEKVNCFLWTGDKKLIRGLENLGFNNILTTNLLYFKFFSAQ